MPDSLPNHSRLFVSVPVPEAVRCEVEQTQTRLQRALNGDGVRWTRRDQFHLTLRFLGNVEICRIDQLIQALRECSARFQPIPLCAEGIGSFPEGKAPRVIWIGIRDESGQLALLQSAVQTACQPFTLEAPELRFHGHVTIARIRFLDHNQGRIARDLFLEHKHRAFGTWTADHLELMRSELSSHGARHTCLAQAPLGPGAR